MEGARGSDPMQLITFKPIHGGTIALAVLLQFSSPTSMQGAVPPNDTCAGAAAIPAAGPFPYLTPLVPDITDATSAGDPLTPPCLRSGSTVSRSIWYTFTPAQTALYSLSLAYDTATTVDDTVMAIYTSLGGCAGSFNIVACSEDEVDNRSAIATNLNASTTYYIVVWQFGPDAPPNGKTAIQLRVNLPVPPANDHCSGAETIPSSGPFPYLTMTNDTFQATSANDPPLPSCQRCEGVVSRTIWYKFTPAATATYTISSCAGTATTILDTVMAIYTSSSACGGTFTEVECNDTDNDCEEDRAAITSFLSAGTDYFIVLSECDAQLPGPGRTLVQLLVSVPPPSVTSFMKLANGHFQARFSGVTGQAYTIQTSTNLVHWTDLGAPTSLGTNTFEFIDTAAMGFPARFYRVKSP